MLKDELAALKAQVNELKHAHEQRLITMTNDEVAAVFAKSPQACLNDHNKNDAPLMVFGDDKIIVYSSSGKKYEYDLDGKLRGAK